MRLLVYYVGFLDSVALEIRVLIVLETSIDAKLFYIFTFYLYIYFPDSHESDGDATDKANNYPDLLLEMPKYCCPIENFYFVF